MYILNLGFSPFLSLSFSFISFACTYTHAHAGKDLGNDVVYDTTMLQADRALLSRSFLFTLLLDYRLLSYT